jgi:hypothetical protein
MRPSWQVRPKYRLGKRLRESGSGGGTPRNRTRGERSDVREQEGQRAQPAVSFGEGRQ